MTTPFDERDPASILAVLDLAPAMVRDFGGLISFWTSGAERLYGWTARETIGRVSHDLLATVFPKPLEEIEADLLREGFWHGTLEHRTRDGQLVRVASHWALQRDADGRPAAVAEVNTDIGPQQRAEAARMRLAAIVSSSSDAVMASSLDGTVTDWNAAAEMLFGYNADEMVGGPSAILGPPELSIDEFRVLADVERGDKTGMFESVRHHRDGSAIPVAISVSAITDPSGVTVGVATIMRDLRARNERDRRLAELRAKLSHFGRLSELGQLLAALVHELSQPLSAINNYAGGLEDLLASDRRDLMPTAVDGIKNQVIRARAIIRRMRDFVRKGTPLVQGHDLSEIFDDAVALLLLSPIAKGVRIHTNIETGARRILADRIEIQQVLFNLLKNALEAMVGQREAVVTITAVVSGDGLIEIRVADSGPGIPDSVLSELYQPFVTTKAEGMGMGLSICQTIIEAHGGNLTVKSQRGNGSTFCFTLQAEPVTLNAPAD